MISQVQFSITPKIIVDLDTGKSISFKNKKLDLKLKNQIKKDFISSKSKKYLQQCIFDNGSNDVDDLSQYLDGSVTSLTYDPSKDNFVVVINVLLSKVLPKPFSSLKKSELLSESEIHKLMTKQNLAEMIKENLTWAYSSSGHFKSYTLNKEDVYVDISQNNVSGFKTLS